MQMSHKFKRLCQWAVIGGFRSVLFVKHVERWMAKDIRYARNTESGYKNLNFSGFSQRNAPLNT